MTHCFLNKRDHAMTGKIFRHICQLKYQCFFTLKLKLGKKLGHRMLSLKLDL